MLLNAVRRDDAFAFVRARAPGSDPARQIAAWLRQLSAVTAKLQAAGVPWQPNLLGLPEFNDELERVLVDLLGGEGSTAADESAAKFIAHLRSLPALACLFA